MVALNSHPIFCRAKQKLKNGEDLLNVQDQLNRLGLGSLATNKKLIQDENDKTTKKRIGLETDKKIYEINELSKIQIKTQNSLLKDRLSLIENSINIQSRKQSFDAESKAEQDSLNRQIAIKNIREEIASKPFASNTDKVRLLEAEKAFALAEETARISEAANKRELNGYNERSAALLQLTKNQELFSNTQRESFAKEIEQANKIPDIKKKNEFGVEIFNRKKIDSEILLEIIYTSKNFKVLSDYNGGAALLFTSINEPNVIYAFHGASSETKNGALIEERPLYYVETKEGWYFCSIKSSSTSRISPISCNVKPVPVVTIYIVVN